VPIKPIQAASQTQANRMSSSAKPTLMPSIYQNWAMSQNTPLITLAIKTTTPLPALYN
jgi:hypothetical protein